MSVRLMRNVLVPGWIVGLGLVAITAPPQNLASALSLFVVGLLVLPALALARGAAVARDGARVTGGSGTAANVATPESARAHRWLFAHHWLWAPLIAAPTVRRRGGPEPTESG